MTAPIQPTIFQAMARVLNDLPAIGKNQRNQQQGYAFRGIDDVIDALNPLLAKHGVFFVPEVIERLEGERTTGKGGTMYVVNLHVRYTFYGPQGDSVVASGWGEGTDMGDKSTQKAMTGAMKYVLFQVFAIATHEQAEADSDLETPEATSRRAGPVEVHASASTADAPGPAPSSAAPKDRIATLVTRVERLNLGDWVKDQHYAWPWDDDVCDVIEARCDLTVSFA